MRPFIYKQQYIALPVPATAKDLQEGDLFKTESSNAVFIASGHTPEHYAIGKHTGGTTRFSPDYPIFKLIIA